MTKVNFTFCPALLQSHRSTCVPHLWENHVAVFLHCAYLQNSHHGPVKTYTVLMKMSYCCTVGHEMCSTGLRSYLPAKQVGNMGIFVLSVRSNNWSIKCLLTEHSSAAILNICMFQLLICEESMLFFAICDHKLNILMYPSLQVGGIIRRYFFTSF